VTEEHQDIDITMRSLEELAFSVLSLLNHLPLDPRWVQFKYTRQAPKDPAKGCFASKFLVFVLYAFSGPFISLLATLKHLFLFL